MKFGVFAVNEPEPVNPMTNAFRTAGYALSMSRAEAANVDLRKFKGFYNSLNITIGMGREVLVYQAKLSQENLNDAKFPNPIEWRIMGGIDK
ncbi:hypothetical protein A28LD_0379 [Idiomarina sp. A28L]|nr:hypothetical protein A28LD_0379 [Idiomarina sp. A28L]